MVATLQVTAATKVVNRRLKVLAERTGNLRPYFKRVGPDLVASTKGRFKAQHTHTGRAWKPSAAAKRAQRLTLVDTGALMDSIQVKMGRKGQLAVGTDIDYGKLHQKGYRVKARWRMKKRHTSAGQLLKRQLAAAAPSVSLPSLPSVGNPLDALRGPSLRNPVNLPARRRQAQPRMRRIPPRRFLGISIEDRRLLSKNLTRHLKATRRVERN